MYNLYRKGIILIAGLGLLLLSGCTTVPGSDVVERESLTLYNIFPAQRETLIYFELNDNLNLIHSVLDSFPINSVALDLINSSSELYLGFNQDVSSGFDAIIKGKFSKWKAELGLFFSFDWKKVKDRGTKYWLSRDGLKIYFESDNVIIVSTFNIIPLINSSGNSFLDPPTESILLVIPKVDDGFTKKLSNGFIKGGIKNISITLDKVDADYKMTGTLGLESESKARGFRLLMTMFLKLMLSSSVDENVVKIGQNLEITSVKDSVIVKNINLNEIFLTDFINKIILIDGDTDK